MSKRTLLFIGFTILLLGAGIWAVNSYGRKQPTSEEQLLRSAKAMAGKASTRAEVAGDDRVALTICEQLETVSSMFAICRKLPGDPAQRLLTTFNEAFNPLGYVFEDHSRPGSQGEVNRVYECPVVIYKEGNPCWVLYFNLGSRINDLPQANFRLNLSTGGSADVNMVIGKQ